MTKGSGLPDFSGSADAGQLQPRIRPARKRTHPGNSIFPEQERRTGARSFVRSSAEKNDVAIARNFVVSRRHLTQRDAERARNWLIGGRTAPFRFEAPDVDHYNVLHTIEHIMGVSCTAHACSGPVLSGMWK